MSTTEEESRTDAKGPVLRGPAAFLNGPVDKSADLVRSGRRLLGLLGPERRLMYASVVLTAANVLPVVLGPYVMSRATDRIVEGMTGRAGVDFGAVGRILLIVLALYTAATVFMVWQGRLVSVAVQRAMHRLREQVQAKLSRLPLAYFDRQPHGEVLSRVTNDIDNVSQTLQQTLSQILFAVLSLTGVVAAMFLISPLMALVALATVPVSLVVVRYLAKRAQPQFLAQWDTTGKLNGHVEEMFTGHALVRVFGRQKESARLFEKYNEGVYATGARAQFLSGLSRPAMMLMGNLNYILIAVVGGLRVAADALTIGGIQMFIQYSQQATQAVNQATGMANMVQSGLASAERVFDLLDEEELTPDAAAPRTLERVRGQVRFERVGFRYDPDTPLIEELSLTVEPGQTVAIVGPTGAGKTTLVNLLMRFYEVDGGQITLDGIDITGLTREELRSKIGMVLQDAWLFDGTIADNIAYGAPDPSPERIVEAARATHVDRFVRTLPEGYQTVLEDEGAGLSAGERQLITIARAFASDPAILILDEATSSVDTRTELLIQRAMNSLRAGRTSFVIAHRLSTIRDADLILVMESGRIVEAGTHETLRAAGGAYARLYAAQFAEPHAGTG